MSGQVIIVLPQAVRPQLSSKNFFLIDIGGEKFRAGKRK
jgi:hypothetical protein